MWRLKIPKRAFSYVAGLAIDYLYKMFTCYSPQWPIQVLQKENTFGPQRVFSQLYKSYCF